MPRCTGDYISVLFTPSTSDQPQLPSSIDINCKKMAANPDNVELIPGTEVMNNDGSVKKQLIPKPSSDPRDPLNWSRKWKSMFCQR